MPFNDTCPFCKKKFVKTDEITIESNVIYHKKCVLEQYEIAEKREKQHLIDLITEDTYNKIEDNFGWIPGDIEDWEKVIRNKYIAYFYYTSSNTAWGILRGFYSLKDLKDEVKAEICSTDYSLSINFILIDKEYVEFDVDCNIKIKKNKYKKDKHK